MSGYTTGGPLLPGNIIQPQKREKRNSYHDVEEPRSRCAERKKPDTEGHVWRDSTSREGPEKVKQQIESRSVVPKGGGAKDRMMGDFSWVPRFFSEG